jgi:hypothetical protein
MAFSLRTPVGDTLVSLCRGARCVGHIDRSTQPAGRKMLMSNAGCNLMRPIWAKRVDRSRCRGSPRHRLGRLAMPNTLRRGRPFRRGGLWVASAQRDATCANVGGLEANRAGRVTGPSARERCRSSLSLPPDGGAYPSAPSSATDRRPGPSSCARRPFVIGCLHSTALRPSVAHGSGLARRP